LTKLDSQVQVKKNFYGTKEIQGAHNSAATSKTDPPQYMLDDNLEIFLKITLQPQEQRPLTLPWCPLHSVLMRPSWLLLLLALPRKIHQSNKNGDQEDENVDRI